MRLATDKPFQVLPRFSPDSPETFPLQLLQEVFKNKLQFNVVKSFSTISLFSSDLSLHLAELIQLAIHACSSME